MNSGPAYTMIATPAKAPVALLPLLPSCKRNPGSVRGTVILVTLCFVAVLGIVLASYLAVCSRAMQLSNRSFQNDLSRQLAEAGIEEGLRAFNKNNWADWTSSTTTVDWTLDTTNKRATATLSIPSTKFGQGVTASIKIRVDNYDATVLGSTWSNAKTYRIGDLVGSSGIWYRSVRSGNLNQTPSATNLTWWITNPMPWTWSSDTTYAQYQMVNYKGIWYRCAAVPPVSAGTTTYAPQVPLPATTYWTPIPTQRAWASSTSYSQHDVVSYTDPTTGDIGLYRCTSSHTSSANFSSDTARWSSSVQTVSLAWSSGSVYTRGSITYYSGASRWYYCRQSGTSSTAPSTDTTMWAPMYNDGSVANPASDTLVNPTNYLLGDYVYYSGAWYRCTLAHTYSGSWTPSNWSAASPYIQLIWFNGGLSTTSNSIFYYAGATWYRYMSGYNVALTTMPAWTSGYKYNVGDSIYYSALSKWYRCILAHTASATITPASTTYWATTPALSVDWASDKGYSVNDLVRYKGVWYLCIQANTSSSSILPTNTSYWIGADTTNTSYKWNSTSQFSANTYACYGGVWYKCLATNTGSSPNNTTNWTATWSQSSGVSTGAPVVYAEATVSLGDQTTTRTQLRTAITPAPLFPSAAAASNGIINVTSGGTVDSYDSTTGTYASQVDSTTNYSARLAANTSITLATTAVRGYIASAPSSSSPYAPVFSSGGTLKSYTTPGTISLDLSRASRSPYIPKFDTLPTGGLSTNWSTTPKGQSLGTLTSTTNLGTAGDTVPSRYYYAGNLTIGTATLNVLKFTGPAILYVQGNLSITSSGSVGRLEVSSTGSAEIHVTGTFTADTASDGIKNYTNDPKSLIIICDTTSTSTHSYSDSTNDLIGVVYIPSSTSTTGFSSSNSSTHIYGAVSANNITYSGTNMNIHYDTSLLYATFGGVDEPYAITNWTELSTTEAATMP